MYQRRNNTGGLVVPKGAKIIKEEPAIPMTVESILPLVGGVRRVFGNPLACISKISKPGLFRTKDVETEDAQTVFLDLPKRQLTHTETSMLKKAVFKNNQELKGIHLLASPYKLEGSKDWVYRVAVVEFKKGDLHGRIERQLDTVEKIRASGFMRRDDVSPDPEYIIVGSPKDRAIFRSKPPSADAIVQGQFGNCFLLASVGSMLRTKEGQDYIQNIMKQQDDGSVIVRLFNPSTSKFEYIQVDNSYLVTGTWDGFKDTLRSPAHKEPWVNILEKAYAVLASKSSTDPHALFPSYMSIFTGDTATHAMLILTGKQANEFQIRNASSDLSSVPTDRAAEYTASQIQLWETIGEELKAGKIVTCATPKFPKMVAGIIDEHAYAVVGVGVKRVEGSLPLYMVRLRNPWGYVAREYKPDGAPHETGAAEFDLELRDFTRYFSHVQLGEYSNIPTLIIDDPMFLKKSNVSVMDQIKTAFLQAGILTEKSGKLVVRDVVDATDIDKIETFIKSFTMELVDDPSILGEKDLIDSNAEYKKLCEDFQKNYLKTRELYEKIKKCDLKDPERRKIFSLDCLLFVDAIETLQTIKKNINSKANELKGGEFSSSVSSPETRKSPGF